MYRELPRRVREWMDRLQEEGIRGADLVFACIGPALQIYSQYAKVVDAQDREIPLGGDPEAKEPHKRGYLAYVWEAVGRAALEQVLGRAEANARDGTSGALEEDSRMTALFLWTLQTTAVGDVNGGAETDDGDQAEEDEDGENGRSSKKGGFNLPFDVVRRFAQPLGIHLPEWEGRVIETAKGVVRLIPVAERTKQLFGDDGVQIVASRVTQVKAGPEQLTMALFPESDAPRIGGRGRGRGSAAKKPSDRSSTVGYQATTLDRVHAAMLLQASGQANALRALLKAEQDRGPEFLRLANALSALYPEGSQEERLLDAMLLAVPR